MADSDNSRTMPVFARTDFNSGYPSLFPSISDPAELWSRRMIAPLQPTRTVDQNEKAILL